MPAQGQKASTKRISKVVIKRMVDESPDTSWLGEYANRSTSEFSIDRRHTANCPVNVYGEDEDGCNCSEQGDMGRNKYLYFNPSFNYVDKSGKALLKHTAGPLENTPDEVRKYVRQDYERMESLNRGDWCFISIRAEAEIQLNATWKNSVVSKASWNKPIAPYQTIMSGGLWGTESDASEDYLRSIEKEELSDLRAQLEAIGFSKRAVSAAFRNVEHSE